ncbi:MAG: hypothetical protein ACFCUT_20935 [Kiloniellaceae bacterium]
MQSDLEGLLAWKGAAVLAFFLAERWRPAARPLSPAASSLAARAVRGGWYRVLRNLGLWLVVSALSPLIVLPLTYWASGQALGWRPAWNGRCHGS